ncbi:hypothetical protein [Paenibacillus sp. MMS18-CY102]|uniref:hypothetical protein n=1 Tax=Paenibacillus sp. MMS18-CY102 TaxID=2682849 RepID=UPI00136540D3|nr:hypothetical protein [Paenibacillus sp. MMS18-CY102]MWC29213.1 hypothetical protein [Paenibacillus sp. MMS18-CY102]
MTKIGMAMLLAGAVALLSGCTSYTKLDEPSLDTYREEISKAVPGILSLKTTSKPTRILFRYAFDTTPDTAVQQDIIKRTDRYIHTEAFKNEVLESYYKSYSKKDRIPPDVALPMDTDGDGEANFEYYASLGQNGNWSWWHSDYKTMATEVKLP